MTRSTRANNTAAYDHPPARCTQSYLVASVPRSGSTLLCRALWDMGVAGAPKEYFNPVHREELAARLCPGPADDYLDALLRVRTSPNGVFGCKAHWNHFRDHLLHDATIERLPALRFVKIVRHDALGQAISFVRAQQTGQWSSEQVARREPHFDRDQLAAALRKIVAEDAAWEAWFERTGVAPLRLSYEELTGDYEGTLRRVLGFLEIGSHRLIPPPTLRKQRDAISEAWRRRYRRGDPGAAGVRP